jgi:hypothetical protein
MANHFLERGAKKDKQSKAYWRSSKQEKGLAQKLGGFKTPGSGAGFTATRAGQRNRNHKGDVFVKDVARIEAKSTQHKSFSVTQEMLDKIENASVAMGEAPAIVIEFLDSLGKPTREVAVIPMWALEALIHAAKANQAKPRLQVPAKLPDLPSIPDEALAEVLNRGGVQKSRMASHTKDKFFIHVSDLMQSATERKFCARQHAITFVEERGEAIAKRVTPGMELLHVFGHGAQDHITKLFIDRSPFGHTVWGDWGCGCYIRSRGQRGTRVRQSLKPDILCAECRGPIEHYVETDLIQKKYNLVGHPDLYLLWNGVLHQYEVKTIERTSVDFDTLKDPLGEHTLQNTFYYWMATDMHSQWGLPLSGSSDADGISTSIGRVRSSLAASPTRSLSSEPRRGHVLHRCWKAQSC